MILFAILATVHPPAKSRSLLCLLLPNFTIKQISSLCHSTIRPWLREDFERKNSTKNAANQKILFLSVQVSYVHGQFEEINAVTHGKIKCCRGLVRTVEKWNFQGEL